MMLHGDAYGVIKINIGLTHLEHMRMYVVVVS